MSASIANQVLQELKEIGDPQKAKDLMRFFKTGKGEYGEGDVFLGVKVPQQRQISKKYYKEASLSDLEQLLSSPFHEGRLTGVFILVEQYKKAKAFEEKEALVNFYINNLQGINNWDLVDSSAPYILSDYLGQKKEFSMLKELAKSSNLWKQRVGIMGTMGFIKINWFEPTFEIADMLLNHPHDLIHKAVGWMLREVGNININAEEDFLKERYKSMPRTMLRYAIEKFPEEKRQDYLKGRI